MVRLRKCIGMGGKVNEVGVREGPVPDGKNKTLSCGALILEYEHRGSEGQQKGRKWGGKERLRERLTFVGGLVLSWTSVRE